MKNLALAVVVAFVANLVGAAFADACMVRAPAQRTTVQPTLCCLTAGACVAGACASVAHAPNCIADGASIAAAQPSPDGGKVKPPTATAFTPAKPIDDAALHAVDALSPSANQPGISSYRDIYARSGRLLI